MNKNSKTGVDIGGNATLTNSVVAGRDGAVSNSAGGAEAISTPETVAELRIALNDLLEQVTRRGSELADAELVADTTRQAVLEAAKERPNRLVLSGFLHAVGQAVAGIASLAGVVSMLELAVRAIFG